MRPRLRYLLVDAHSVIFACPELLALHRRNMEAAREQLIQRLTAYQDATGVHVVVVFDGKGARHSQEKIPGGVQVFYSGSKGTADQIVERLVANWPALADEQGWGARFGRELNRSDDRPRFTMF